MKTAKYIFIVFIVLFAGFGFMYYKFSPTYRYSNKADEALKNGNYHRALELYNKSLKAYRFNRHAIVGKNRVDQILKSRRLFTIAEARFSILTKEINDPFLETGDKERIKLEIETLYWNYYNKIVPFSKFYSAAKKRLIMLNNYYKKINDKN